MAADNNTLAFIEIPVEEQTGQCLQSYRVRFRKSGETNYTNLAPDPIVGPIRIENLSTGSAYEVRIAALCCNDVYSDEQVFNVNTPTTTPAT